MSATVAAERPVSLEAALELADGPVLVVSSFGGRGSYSIGEALAERLRARGLEVRHASLEELTSTSARAEDSGRYRMICDRYPFLLHLIYRFPVGYYRKYLRERLLQALDTSALEAELRRTGARTFIGISHRPTFLAAAWRRRGGALASSLRIAGVATDFAPNAGWRYLFWDQVSAFLSPLPTSAWRLPLPSSVRRAWVELPARLAYDAAAKEAGSPDHVLVSGGYWGLGPVTRVVGELHALSEALTIHVACGDNAALQGQLDARYGQSGRVRTYMRLETLAPLMRQCGAMVTKPGMAALLEARAARRKIFLFEGLPVVEAENARFAVQHLGAETFSPAAFLGWRGQQAGSGG